MDTIFPFGFPTSTSLYLLLYLATLVLHVVFMNYVLAGSCYLALRNVVRGGRVEGDVPARLLRDWLPFMLGAAITAGVGPLLFVQVLYQERFYTANLLLFGRWMAILPVLIVAFYGLYLLKTDAAILNRNSVRIALTALVFLCFGFVAWSWTENHLLSVRDQQTWNAHYIGDAWLYHTAELYPRLATWFTGCFPTLAVMLAWQVWCLAGSFRGESEATGRLQQSARGEPPLDAESVHATLRRLAIIALSGIGLAAAFATIYYCTLSDESLAAMTGPPGFPYLVLAVAGLLLQIAGWGSQLRVKNLSARRLTVISLGVISTLSGVAVVRETLRLSQVDVAALIERAEQAARIGGGSVFAVFLAINTALIVYCVRLVARHRGNRPHSDKPPT